MRGLVFVLFGLILQVVSVSTLADVLVTLDIRSDAAELKFDILQKAMSHVNAAQGFKLVDVSSSPDITVKMAVASVKKDGVLVGAAIAIVVLRKDGGGAKLISKFDNEFITIDKIEEVTKKIMEQILVK